MNLFHTHQWVEQSRVFVPPTTLFKADRITEQAMLKLFGGYTSIVLRCASCGAMNTTDALGDHSQK